MSTASAIAHDVATGRRRAVDEIARTFAVHASTHERLNALIQTRPEAATGEATAIDRQIAENPAAGAALPLAGVPVSVKECFPVIGLRTTLGIPVRKDAADTTDAWLVTRLTRAGGIVVGKGNVPQAMFLHETDNPVWGRTLHPLRDDRSPGGSSGGDAALVAAGVVPLAVGNDLAGSLRQPAHACGIAALLPRSRAVGDGGAFDTTPHLTVVRPRAGFLATTVADLRLALTTCGRPAADPPVPPVPRVGWWDDAGPIPASTAVARAVREAVAHLAAAGVPTVRLDGRLATEAAWLQFAILGADGGHNIRSLYRTPQGRSRPTPGVRRLLDIARMSRSLRRVLAAAAELTGRRLEAEALRGMGPCDSRGVAALHRRRDELADRCERLLAGCDAVVCPVSAVPALRHGTAAQLVLAAAPCLLANLLDLAAGTVPVTEVHDDEERRPFSRDPVLGAAAECDRDSRGLPVGVQIVAAPGRGEATVLDLMERIESARRSPGPSTSGPPARLSRRAGR
jgi:fatty acid amide hydrolase